MIVVFGGRIGSGKSTLTDYLKYRYGYKKISMAGRLKDITAELYQWDRSRLDDGFYKAELLDKPVKFADEQWLQISKMLAVPVSSLPTRKFSFTTRREALQFIGTEFLRAYDKDFHTNEIEKQIKSKTNYVVDDVRFLNELKLFKKKQAKTIYIKNPTAEEATQKHSSENSLFESHFDYSILNDQDISTLISRFDSIYQPMCLSTNKEADLYMNWGPCRALEKKLEEQSY